MSKRQLFYLGQFFEVEYDYQPEEKAERGIDAQYPGCGEELTIEEIKYNGVDFTEIMEPHANAMEKQLLEEINSYKNYRYAVFNRD